MELMAAAKAELGHGAEAVEIYGRLASGRRLSPWGYYNLGRLHQLQGRTEAAEEAYQRALRLDGTLAPAWNNLGLLHLERGDLQGAVAVFRRALQLSPGFVEGWNNLGVVLDEAGDIEGAEAAYQKALQLEPDHISALFNLAHLYQRTSKYREAEGLLVKLLQIQPSHQEARFLLAALKGEMVARPPSSFVRRLFDGVAGRFDEILQDQLEYRTPEQLHKLLLEVGAVKGRGLDLGCGTGLGSLLYRPSLGLLIGGDISPKMLKKAREKGGYDHLLAFDLFAPWPISLKLDLVYAADVMVYCGDMAAACARVRENLVPGGAFGFSVELLREEEGVRLLPSGRYAHSRGAVEAALAATGFEVIKQVETVLRKEGGVPVEGLLVAARAG